MNNGNAFSFISFLTSNFTNIEIICGSVHQINQLMVRYEFDNPFFDYDFENSISRAWKNIILTLIEGGQDKIDNNRYKISSEFLKKLVTKHNPETIIDPSTKKEIEEEVEQDVGYIFLDMRKLKSALITVNNYDELILFDRLVLNNFPTYHQEDANLFLVENTYRLPISLLPKKFIETVTFSLPEKYSPIIEQYSLPLKINVKFNIIPIRQVIHGIIRGHLQKQLMEIKEMKEGDTELFTELREFYKISEETKSILTELQSL